MNVQSGSSLVSDSCNASPVNVPEIIPLSIQGEEDEQNNLVRQEEDKQNNLQQEQKNQEENDVNRQVEKFSYNPDTETFQVWWGGFRKPTTEPESSLIGIDANYIQEAKDNPHVPTRPTGARIGSTIGDVSTTDFPMQCSGRFGAVLSLWNALFLLGFTMLEEHLTSLLAKGNLNPINKLTSAMSTKGKPFGKGEFRKIKGLQPTQILDYLLAAKTGVFIVEFSGHCVTVCCLPERRVIVDSDPKFGEPLPLSHANFQKMGMLRPRLLRQIVANK